MISVIIPLYNKEKIVARCLHSVLSQDYDDFEVIVVNDGSTDRSVEVMNDSLTIKQKTLTTIINQENGGPSKARNTGTKAAKGEWIVYLDADDELLPGALRRFAEMIERHPEAGFIACPFIVDDGERETVRYNYKEGVMREPFKAGYYDAFLPRTGAFACKRALLMDNPFREDIRRFEDLELLYRLYRTAKIYLCAEPSMKVNVQFAEASHGRKDISEDFLGHIDFKGRSFWERMCLYKFYLGERPHYKEQCKALYPSLERRYDLLLLTKLLAWLRIG